MRLRAPIVVRPVTTACGPTIVPAPIRTCGPTTEKAPTSTSAASSARASISAVGCRRGMSSTTRCVADRGNQLRFAGQLAGDARSRLELADAANDAHDVRFKDQLVAGYDLALEPRVVDARKEDEGPAAGLGVSRQIGEEP